MNKIPVGHVIGQAYGFAFGSFLSNLGVAWLPLLIYGAAGWFALPSVFQSMSHMMDTVATIQPGTQADPMVMMGPIMQFYRILLLLSLLQFLIRTEIMLGITRNALGLAKGPTFVFLSVGAPFWRLLGSYFIVSIFLIVLYIGVWIAMLLIGLLVGLIAAASFSGGGDHTTLAAGLLGGGVVLGEIAIFSVMLFAFVRLTFLLTPAVVAEERLAVTRSWELTRGNFWRSVLIGIAIFFPLMILANIIFFSVAVGMFEPIHRFILAHAGEQTQDPRAAMQFMHEFMNSLGNAVVARWYILAPVLVVYLVLFYGLAAGAAASAYRSLVPETTAP
ncbi:MAG TPA: hypothetical protein VGG48_05775 [Rhizomicrobium sp.]|jgi:hypothetical protein